MLAWAHVRLNGLISCEIAQVAVSGMLQPHRLVEKRPHLLLTNDKANSVWEAQGAKQLAQAWQISVNTNLVSVVVLSIALLRTYGLPQRPALHLRPRHTRVRTAQRETQVLSCSTICTERRRSKTWAFAALSNVDITFCTWSTVCTSAQHKLQKAKLKTATTWPLSLRFQAGSLSTLGRLRRAYLDALLRQALLSTLDGQCGRRKYCL